MKRIVYNYRVSKYKRFTEGLLFAIIAVIALTLCLADISAGAAGEEILLPFCIAVLSMLLGFVSMFHSGRVSEKKLHN